ncbi:LuxR C-terminal-related transcriptional regulator [Frigoribacterium sp. 2-23]|uniref:LuxR C-terminal-related transcriptional regulator n=1 Tax=Frigoribacterium sp. 2-23 TaxID=3415006 RepID=UPI003C6F25B2
MGDNEPQPSAVTTVHSVDDHEIMSLAIEQMLAPAADLEFGVAAITVDGLLERCPDLRGHLVLLDLRLGDGSSPRTNADRLIAAGAGVIGFTSGENPYLVRLVSQTEALGVVSKATSAERLVAMLRRASAGDPIVSTEWAAAVESDPLLPDAGLSPQEQNVLRLFAAGHKAVTVADAADIAVGTVDDYVRRIRRKYAMIGRPAATKVDLYKRALEDGFLPVPGQER